MSEGHGFALGNIKYFRLCLVVVFLGGKGVRVSTPFIMNIFGLMI
jgi:hypothetical protein